MPDVTANQLIVGVFTCTSAICFVQMAWDKLCARKGWRRIPEFQLLFWAFIGGALGGKLAQRLFRHKTVKQPFSAYLQLWFIVNVVAYGIALTPSAREGIAWMVRGVLAEVI